jgi:hypothetical protein
MSRKFKLFGKKGSKDESKKTFFEKDNLGTRQDTLSSANAYWSARISSPKKDPYIVYTFPTEAAAKESLLEMPFIHVAEDSKELICSKVLIFGYYPTEANHYEAILCGEELTHDLWVSAKEVFAKHGGVLKGEAEPEGKVPVQEEPKKAKAGKVKFVREDRQMKMGHTFIYRIYKGPDAATAQAFLQENPVTKQLYYIVVETPEGNFCRDIQGIYKE